MTWLAVLRAVLALANIIAEIVRNRQLMDAGEAKATAKSLASIAERLRITDEIRAEVGKMTEAEIDDELKRLDQP